ncbi:hypothetical protein L198_07020 [Cryptococcus wingfieldii CBS 7118]|uniref:Uncharacterized protein n=1 Tax=Cryptococcus wingfieldii CBS 7118 TaxID=1295528 RepID=A0A1E3IHI5_9TREE|nr:hypothetical protein L198_07020 [Cryptococcus wingfieldii CBS 7118]ODN87396.1 hypothetical protein L198_07020 [Cryptococcus wingfieldii CBS 7118]
MSPQIYQGGPPRLLPRPRTPPREGLPPVIPTHPNSLVRLPTLTHLSQTHHDAYPPKPPAPPPDPSSRHLYPQPFPDPAPFTTKEVVINPPAKEDKQVRAFWNGMRERGYGVGVGVGGMYAGRWHPCIGVVGPGGVGAVGYGQVYSYQPPMMYGGYYGGGGGGYGRPGPGFDGGFGFG